MYILLLSWQTPDVDNRSSPRSSQLPGQKFNNTLKILSYTIIIIINLINLFNLFIYF